MILTEWELAEDEDGDLRERPCGDLFVLVARVRLGLDEPLELRRVARRRGGSLEDDLELELGKRRERLAFFETSSSSCRARFRPLVLLGS